MNATFNKEKLVAVTASMLFVTALAGLLYTNHTNQSLGGLLDETKLKSEQLFSEKLSLDKEIIGYKSQLTAMLGKNSELDKKIVIANVQLSKAEKELKNIAYDKNKSRKLEGQLAEINKIRSDLEKQMGSLNSTIADLMKQNEGLMNSLASLEHENESIANNYEILRSLVANNYRVDATRGRKEKPTVSARKTKKLAMSFDLPKDISENIKFHVITPEGKKISSENGEITFKEIETISDMTASVTIGGGDLTISKRIELTYNPDSKLKSGIYKIIIFNDDTQIGSCQVRLK